MFPHEELDSLLFLLKIRLERVIIYRNSCWLFACWSSNLLITSSCSSGWLRPVQKCSTSNKTAFVSSFPPFALLHRVRQACCSSCCRPRSLDHSSLQLKMDRKRKWVLSAECHRPPPLCVFVTEKELRCDGTAPHRLRLCKVSGVSKRFWGKDNREYVIEASKVLKWDKTW